MSDTAIDDQLTAVTVVSRSVYPDTDGIGCGDVDRSSEMMRRSADTILCTTGEVKYDFNGQQETQVSSSGIATVDTRRPVR